MENVCWPKKLYIHVRIGLYKSMYALVETKN